jgi:hypothetical protein
MRKIIAFIKRQFGIEETVESICSPITSIVTKLQAHEAQSRAEAEAHDAEAVRAARRAAAKTAAAKSAASQAAKISALVAQ